MTENRWGLWSAIAFVLIAASVGGVIPSYDTGLLTQVLIYGIFAMSLDVLHGYTGMPSLGHAAYFGLAAYVTAICTMQLHWGFAAAGAAGIAASALAAALFHLLALRTNHAYYLMITLAFSQVLWSLAVSWIDVTGGDNGIPGVMRPHIGAWSLGSTVSYFYFVLALFVVSAAMLYIFVTSPFGYALRGIRDNEMRMRALGYHVWAYKYWSSIVSAIFAGVAGELYMYLNSFVSPSSLSVTVSAQVLMMILVGAAGTLFGPVLGAVIFVLLQYVLSTYTDRWLFVIGLIYVALALYAPQGALIYLRDKLKAARLKARA
ncbi:MAG TPA: branched-chain amino acid ABC transporter permease [Stellaceae bacterium]|nr:branched-chain amino acid ABC transporter permease [Stellaceae bacterium]